MYIYMYIYLYIFAYVYMRMYIFINMMIVVLRQSTHSEQSQDSTRRFIHVLKRMSRCAPILKSIFCGLDISNPFFTKKSGPSVTQRPNKLRLPCQEAKISVWKYPQIIQINGMDQYADCGLLLDYHNHAHSSMKKCTVISWKRLAPNLWSSYASLNELIHELIRVWQAYTNVTFQVCFADL